MDASGGQIGAVLLQCIDDMLRPLQFLSHVLDKYQQKYAVLEQECYAVLWSIQKLRRYLVASSSS